MKIWLRAGALIALMGVMGCDPTTPGAKQTITFGTSGDGFTPSTIVVIGAVESTAIDAYDPSGNFNGDVPFCDELQRSVGLTASLIEGSVWLTRTGLQGTTCSEVEASFELDGIRLTAEYVDKGPTGGDCEPCRGSVSFDVGPLEAGTYEFVDSDLSLSLVMP